MKPFKRVHRGVAPSLPPPSSSSAAWRKIHRGGDQSDRLEFRGGSTQQIELPEEEEEWEEDYEYYLDEDGGEDDAEEGVEYEYYEDDETINEVEDDGEGYYYAEDGEYNDEEDINGYYNDDAEEGFLYLPDDEYISVVEEVSLMDFILWCSCIEGRGDVATNSCFVKLLR